MIHPSEEVLLYSSRDEHRNDSTYSNNSLSYSSTLKKVSTGKELWKQFFEEFQYVEALPSKDDGIYEFFLPLNTFFNGTAFKKLRLQRLDVKNNTNNNGDVSLKRSKDFEFDLSFNDTFNPAKDFVQIILEKERSKQEDDLEWTFADITTLETNKIGTWLGEIVSIQNNRITVKIKIPTNASSCSCRLLIIPQLINGDDDGADKKFNVIYCLPGLKVCA